MSAGGTKPLKIGIIAGEESGDILGADLVAALQKITGQPVELTGVGASRLQELGLKPVFNPDIISIMGVSSVLRDLPRLIRNIGVTARAIVDAQPDCLVTIDSPAFNLRVAKKVRALDPTIPIIKYVCPSVWAWGENRAARMKAYTDHVLCLLPFEPDALAKLGGPTGTFVGHRLTHDEGLKTAKKLQAQRKKAKTIGRKTLVVLPGSRRAEIRSLAQPFGETLSILKSRGHEFRVLVPTVDRVRAQVTKDTSSWPGQVEVVAGTREKWKAFGEADVALAASGTVTLELAMAGVPTVVSYKMDRLWRMLFGMISIWSAALPNLIADRAVIPEYFDEFVRPGMLARRIETLMNDGHDRASQLEGFAEVAKRMNTARPAGEIAAEVVLSEIEKKRAS